MDEPGSKLGRDGLGAHATFARLAEEEKFYTVEPSDNVVVILRPNDLGSAVISAAIRFRKAESAVWQTSEVRTKEESANAKHERAMAYLDVVDSVDALLRAREEQKIPGAGSCKDSGTRRD